MLHSLATELANNAIDGARITDMGELVRAYNVLADQPETEEMAEALLDEFPSILNYDERGNFVGAVRGESAL